MVPPSHLDKRPQEEIDHRRLLGTLTIRRNRPFLFIVDARKETLRMVVRSNGLDAC
jgi:hypothetical protein